jgi:hypothetical protein
MIGSGLCLSHTYTRSTHTHTYLISSLEPSRRKITRSPVVPNALMCVCVCVRWCVCVFERGNDTELWYCVCWRNDYTLSTSMHFRTPTHPPTHAPEDVVHALDVGVDDLGHVLAADARHHRHTPRRDLVAHLCVRACVYVCVCVCTHGREAVDRDDCGYIGRGGS